jgi:hypothetical protein
VGNPGSAWSACRDRVDMRRQAASPTKASAAEGGAD